MVNKFIREDVEFYSNGTRCSAWFYLPTQSKVSPVIVMAHGLGGVREMWLDKYAEYFVDSGYACFLFDYRNHGDSDGENRQLIKVKDQLIDWNSAIDFVKEDKRVDINNIMLFGTSFSGGHVITLSSKRKDIGAAIAQCPYTDNKSTIKKVPLINIIKFIPYLIGDLLSCFLRAKPVMIKLAQPQDKLALMQIPNYYEFLKKVPVNSNFINEAPARTILEFIKYSPSKYIKKVNNPIFIAACIKDTLAPANATIKLAKCSKAITIKEYDCGHFDIYFDSFFKTAIVDYIDFYNNHIN